jgi:hypothetical protein
MMRFCILNGIPILDQSLEYPFPAPSPPFEEVPTTLSEYNFFLDDVIDRIENMSLYGNLEPFQSLEKPRPI